MAFQSALAGILLAAELITDAGGLRSVQPPAQTEIDLCRLAIGGDTVVRLNTPAAKNFSGRCICQDDV